MVYPRLLLFPSLLAPKDLWSRPCEPGGSETQPSVSATLLSQFSSSFRRPMDVGPTACAMRTFGETLSVNRLRQAQRSGGYGEVLLR